MRRSSVRKHWPLFGMLVFFLVSLGVSCSASPDGKTLAAYARACSLFEAGRFSEAASAAPPGGAFGFGVFAPAELLRGKALWFQGRSVEAEKTLRSALRARPCSVEVRLWLSRALRSNGKRGDSERCVRDALDDDPGDCRLLRLASELAVDRADPVSARLYLDKAAESGGELGLVFLDRARLRWAAGERKKALEDIAAAEAVTPKGCSAYRAALALEQAVRESDL